MKMGNLNNARSLSSSLTQKHCMGFVLSFLISWLQQTKIISHLWGLMLWKLLALRRNPRTRTWNWQWEGKLPHQTRHINSALTFCSSTTWCMSALFALTFMGISTTLADAKKSRTLDPQNLSHCTKSDRFFNPNGTYTYLFSDNGLTEKLSPHCCVDLSGKLFCDNNATRRNKRWGFVSLTF